MEQSVTTEEETIDKYEHLIQASLRRISVHTTMADDLAQEGRIGLLKALRCYDHTKETSFQTYANIRIFGAMQDWLRTVDDMGRTTRKRLQEMETAILTITQTNCAIPEEDIVASNLNMSLYDFQKLKETILSRRVNSIEDEKSPSCDDRWSDPWDLATPILTGDPSLDSISAKETRALLNEAIQALPAKELKVIILRYVRDLTMREIGYKMKLTEGRISQIHKMACERIKGFLATNDK